MTSFDVNCLAKELLSAYKSGDMVTPPTSRYPDFDLAAAYAVEAELARLRANEGARSVGLKVGYANKAVWRVLKLETLVWAHMYSDTVHYASEGRAQLSLDRMRSSKLEPEIIFSIREPLNAESADPGAALNAMEWISLGFEIIDCPYSDWKFQPADFVASFGLHAALIVGEPTRVEREAIPSLVEQLPQFKVKMFKNGEFVEEGAGKNSLRSPALCLVELSLALVRKPGAQGLRPGDLISSGTLTSGHTLGRGECWRVEVEGLPGSPLTLITT